jgi:hypothetical protein
VAYAAGWTFAFQDVYVPINVAVVPTPLDGHARLTVLTGFNFDYEWQGAKNEENAMNRLRPVFLVVLALVQPPAPKVFCEETRFITLFGPRVGLTYIFAQSEEFDQSVQRMFPNPDRAYTPFMTQFGLTVEQRMLLGSTRSHFAFQEVIVVSGVDQGVFLPSASLLIGFRSHAGLEFGLGPVVSLMFEDESGDIEASVSVVYAVGWTIPLYNVYIPINLAVVPTPNDGFARVSLVSGFNLEL